MIHTSGTTGRPKAVEISHASLVNLLCSMRTEPGFGPSDTMLAVTTISFDIAALELFLPLVSGGCVAIASRETTRDPHLLAAAIERSPCTVMQATPATWRILLSSGWHPPVRPFQILCGGEPMPRDLAERVLTPGTTLWNLYGPTETTIWSTVDRQPWCRDRPIGRPIANTTAYILDSSRQHVPVGIAGHLYLGGAGLARGYRGQPQLTSERFVDLHHAGLGRLYNTGDVARRRADGTIECLGRVDNQVKVRGYRIELEAVESAALRHPQVAGAAAGTWPDSTGGARLSLYLVGRNGPPPDAGTMWQFLQADQPEYVIASDIVGLLSIPLTSNGKIDRAALPAIQPAAAVAATEDFSPTELRLAAIWSEVLKVGAVGPHDDFFHLGGHSLLVSRLQQRIAASFGFRVAMAALFHTPIFRQQAALLEATADENAPVSGLISLQPEGKRANLFWMHPPPEMRAMASALGEDRPLLGLALTQQDIDKLGPNPDMRSIAACHVRAILQMQTIGPYHIGGYCAGGIVAFEAAAQMRAAGHEVSLLIMVDSQNPGSSSASTAFPSSSIRSGSTCGTPPVWVNLPRVEPSGNERSSAQGRCGSCNAFRPR